MTYFLTKVDVLKDLVEGEIPIEDVFSKVVELINKAKRKEP